MSALLASARRHRILIIGLSTLALTACDGGSGGGGGIGLSGSCDQGFDCQELVNNLAANVMLPAVQDFAVAAEALSGRVEDHCTALSTPDSADDASSLAVARQGWQGAMASWQQVEVMQVGPLLDNSGSLRDNIYSWPTTDQCRYDQEVLAAEQPGYDISARTPDRRGMAALGYVLFDETLATSCPINIIAAADWTDRPEAERRVARCDYAALAAADVSRLADQLEGAWTGAGGYLDQVAMVGGGGRFSSVQQVVNEFSDALFYVEKETNDTKLALPAGLLRANSCGDVGTVCPADVESPFAMVSKENIRDNMRSFQKLFLGEAPGDTNATGFYEFFVALDEQNAADLLAADTVTAIASIEAIGGTLKDAVQTTNGLAEVTEAFNRTKDVSRQLKNQFVAILGLSLPDTSAGDND